MYVSVTRVNTGDLPPEASAIVAEEVHRWLDDIEGFEGFLMLSTGGSSVALSFWESRESAERHRVARMQVRERVTAAAGAEIEEVVEYDVVYARLGPLLIDPSQ
jgi:heme-degrading monooxygenase HmoA